ncbi:Uncharacterised protein [uncultured archaeon]|nr:Uncharacterised protein [uncultured archaeon]
MVSKNKKFFKIKLLIIVIVLIFILVAGYFVFFNKNPSKSSNTNGERTVIENPVKQIIIKNTDSSGKFNSQAVVLEGVKEFNGDYINYILLALGIGNLDKSAIFGNPKIEFLLDNEAWNSELKDGSLITKPGEIEKKDLRITMSKEEAVKALISSDISQFMKNSVINGRTKIEMIAGKPELYSKGYLKMYNSLKS